MARFGVLVGRGIGARAPDDREPPRLHAGRVRHVGVPLRPAGAGRAPRRGVVLARAHSAVRSRSVSSPTSARSGLRSARLARAVDRSCASPPPSGSSSLLLLADLGGGWVYDEVSSETHGTAAVADDTFDPAQQPAFRDSPWAAAMLSPSRTTCPSVKDSFLGYRLDSKAGHVHQRRRRRARELPAVGGPATTCRCGSSAASALFGDGQRDQHTIPSEFARLAEVDGIPVRGAQLRSTRRSRCGRSSSCSSSSWLDRARSRISSSSTTASTTSSWQLNIQPSAEPTNIFDSSRGRDHRDAADRAPRRWSPPTSRRRTTRTTRELRDVVDAYWDQSASRHVYDALDELFGGSDPPAVEFAEGVPQRRHDRRPGTRSERAGGAERGVDPGACGHASPTRSPASVGAGPRSSGSRPCSPRSCCPRRRPTSGSPATSRPAGTPRSQEVRRAAEAHTVSSTWATRSTARRSRCSGTSCTRTRRAPGSSAAAHSTRTSRPTLRARRNES